MSSMAVLMLFASGPVAGPRPDGAVIGQTPAASDCMEGSGDRSEIVVCGRRAAPSPRLPMPEDRFADGEVVRHPSDEPRIDPGPPSPPNRLRETLGKTIGGLRSLVTGEDPGF